LSGHNSPAFAPNLLTLLADRGLRAGDEPRVDAVLDEMPRHADEAGHLTTYAAPRRGEPPAWGALLCDNHAIVDVLLRYGRDPMRVPALGRYPALWRGPDADPADRLPAPSSRSRPPGEAGPGER